MCASVCVVGGVLYPHRELAGKAHFTGECVCVG